MDPKDTTPKRGPEPVEYRDVNASTSEYQQWVEAGAGRLINTTLTSDGGIVVTFSEPRLLGDATLSKVKADLNEFLRTGAAQARTVVLDFGEVDYLASEAVGLLMNVAAAFKTPWAKGYCPK